MDELIARLEAATEGSRELDREIECSLQPQHAALIRRDKWDCKAFTITIAISDDTGAVITWDDGHAHGTHKATPIALCIAALRARQRATP
jgi:hypothetical protein